MVPMALRRRLVLVGALLVLGAGATALALGMAGSRGPTPDVYGEVPPFTLIERSGREVGRADLLGRVWVANFIYTSCRDTCPTQTLQLSRLQADLADAPDFRLVSITVDPVRDTPVVLRQYAERFRAGDRWLFLTGEARDIECLATAGFHVAVRGAVSRDCGRRVSFRPAAAEAHDVRDDAPEPIAHSDRLVLVDRRARIRGYEASAGPDVVARLHAAARRLLAER